VTTKQCVLATSAEARLFSILRCVFLDSGNRSGPTRLLAKGWKRPDLRACRPQTLDETVFCRCHGRFAQLRGHWAFKHFAATEKALHALVGLFVVGPFKKDYNLPEVRQAMAQLAQIAKDRPSGAIPTKLVTRRPRRRPANG